MNIVASLLFIPNLTKLKTLGLNYLRDLNDDLLDSLIQKMSWLKRVEVCFCPNVTFDGLKRIALNNRKITWSVEKTKFPLDLLQDLYLNQIKVNSLSGIYKWQRIGNEN